MKKLSLALALLPILLCACAKKEDTPVGTPTATTAGADNGTPGIANKDAKDGFKVAGTWKMDLAATSVPGMTEDDKKEEEAMRLEVKADGTYATSGMKKNDTGKWTLTGNSLALKSDGDGTPPSPLDVSEDGSKLSMTKKAGDKSMTMVMVKE